MTEQQTENLKKAITPGMMKWVLADTMIFQKPSHDEVLQVINSLTTTRRISTLDHICALMEDTIRVFRRRQWRPPTPSQHGPQPRFKSTLKAKVADVEKEVAWARKDEAEAKEMWADLQGRFLEQKIQETVDNLFTFFRKGMENAVFKVQAPEVPGGNRPVLQHEHSEGGGQTT